MDSTSLSDFASMRAHFLEAGLLAYFVEIDTENYVEDRLLADCDDDRTLRLSHAQLERYRRIFDPRADGADYEIRILTVDDHPPPAPGHCRAHCR